MEKRHGWEQCPEWLCSARHHIVTEASCQVEVGCEEWTLRDSAHVSSNALAELPHNVNDVISLSLPLDYSLMIDLAMTINNKCLDDGQKSLYFCSWNTVEEYNVVSLSRQVSPIPSDRDLILNSRSFMLCYFITQCGGSVLWPCRMTWAWKNRNQMWTGVKYKHQLALAVLYTGRRKPKGTMLGITFWKKLYSCFSQRLQYMRGYHAWWLSKNELE